LAPIVLLARAEVLLEENRRLIDAAVLGATAAPAQLQPYQANSAELAQLLARLGHAPSAVLHVGDDLALDVHGARSAGLQACWLRREPGDDDAAHEVPRVSCLKTLAEQLGC